MTEQQAWFQLGLMILIFLLGVPFIMYCYCFGRWLGKKIAKNHDKNKQKKTANSKIKDPYRYSDDKWPMV